MAPINEQVAALAASPTPSESASDDGAANQAYTCAAKPGACANCPWLTANHERRKDDPRYSRESMHGQWQQIRDGSWLFACHMAKPEPPRTVAELRTPRRAECSGALAAQLREVRLLLEANSWEDYHRERPGGLTMRAALNLLRRYRGEQQPPLQTTLPDERAVVDVPAWGPPSAVFVMSKDGTTGEVIPIRDLTAWAARQPHDPEREVTSMSYRAALDIAARVAATNGGQR